MNDPLIDLHRGRFVIAAELQLALLTEDKADDQALAERLCHLDGELAAQMLKDNRPEDAIPYLVSQAWCLTKLERKGHARNLLKIAQRHCKCRAMNVLLDGALAALEPDLTPDDATSPEESVFVIVDDDDPELSLIEEQSSTPKKRKQTKKKRKTKAKRRTVKAAKKSEEPLESNWWSFDHEKKEESSDEQ